MSTKEHRDQRRPRTAGGLLARPKLEARLDEAFGRRLTTIVAGAGYGKTTLLAQWARDVECAWYTAGAADGRLSSLTGGLSEALGVDIGAFSSGADLTTPDEAIRADAIAAHLAADLERTLTHDVILVLDDAHELDASPSARLVESLVRQAPVNLHVVLSSRAEPPFRIQRLRGQGQVLELNASQLGFDAREVEDLLELELGPGARRLAPRLHEVTEGWPVAVRLAIAALERVGVNEREEAIDRLRNPEGALFAYIAEEVLDLESQAVRDFVSAMSVFERFSPALCDALGLPGSSTMTATLERRGLVVSDGAGAMWVHSLVRDFALERLPLNGVRRRVLQRGASRWFGAQGDHLAALREAVAAEDARVTGRVLREHGEDLLLGGSIDAVLEAAKVLTPKTLDARLEQVIGEAHSLRAQWDAALECYERAAAGAEVVSSRLAWLMARLEWDRGRYAPALVACRRGRLDGSSPRDDALLLAWMAYCHWNLGEAHAAEASAQRSLEAARQAHDPRATAAAQSAMALAAGLDLPRAEEHLRLAVDAADDAGDVLLAIRLRLNRTLLLEPRRGLEEIEVVLQKAELAGAGLLIAFSLHRRGETERLLGRLDDAARDFQEACSVFERLGSARSCWPLMYLGDVLRERGDLARARTAYEESLRRAKEVEDTQGLRGSQAGLALVLARSEPPLAAALAEAAVAIARSTGHDVHGALVAAGWVALANGKPEDAALHAIEAAREAGKRRVGWELAEAFELQAMSAPDPALQAPLLAEAATIWREVGNPVAEARVNLALAGLTTGLEARTRASHALAVLRSAGVADRAAAAAGLLACSLPDRPPAVSIQTLGGFAVLREGVPVALGEWRSRKARDLLKVLVGRGGRPAPRELLGETLWPGQNPADVSRRLSVAMSMLRSVLDPDKRFESDQFVAADARAVWLKTTNLAIDVGDFLSVAQAGLTETDADAIASLKSAEAIYAGDFLEEDAYEEWSVSLRERARTVYVEVARKLAGAAEAERDFDAAARYLLRVLELDRHDERAHLDLITTLSQGGRLGDARRAYRIYVDRMKEIDVEAVPYPV